MLNDALQLLQLARGHIIDYVGDVDNEADENLRSAIDDIIITVKKEMRREKQ